MCSFVTLRWCATLVLAGAAVFSARAEVIHLKNGDVIYADSIQDGATKVEYSVGDNTYAIPKSRVQSIDSGTRPNAAPEAQSEIAAYTPDVQMAGDQAILSKIIRDGKVDRVALEGIAAEPNHKQTATAFYLAGKQDYLNAKYSDARQDFEMALANDPENPGILNYYAALLIRIGNAREAVPYAEQAVHIVPDSADAQAVLGYAQFGADHPKDAIESWKKSLALRPDVSIQRVMERAEREASAENDYSERETGHFVLHYEGGRSSSDFRNQLLSTLEADYQDLSSQFGGEPKSSIQVVLYTDQAFFDVTQSPSWAGALNDGKVRIPLQGLDSVTPELARVLKHELTHSFVSQIAMGRCPQWLNEGIAQVMEAKSLVMGPQLAQLFQQEQEVPLSSLEGSFTAFSQIQAVLAYDESLAAAQHIRDHYGMGDVVRILQKLGQGESTESALRSTIHCDYRQLQDEVRADLAREYGH